MRATHWIAANEPELSQAIASIVINFGILEHQLAKILENLQDCPPNTRTVPKKTLSEVAKSVEDSARKAFGSSPLADRLVAFSTTSLALSVRRNIITHGMIGRSSQGGFVAIHTKKRHRIIYEVEIDDIVALDNDIAMANIDLQHFIMGTADQRVPASKDNRVMSALFWMAMKPEGPPHVCTPTKVKFPRS